MAYLCGDNNLEKYALKIINDMERGYIDTKNVKIVVLVDRSDNYDENNGNWTGAGYYEITHDDLDSLNSKLLRDEGEINMGEHSVLRKFVDYCFDNYTADNYLLAIWDHGGGVDGICYDDNNGADDPTSSHLSVNNLASAINYGVTCFN